MFILKLSKIVFISHLPLVNLAFALEESVHLGSVFLLNFKEIKCTYISWSLDTLLGLAGDFHHSLFSLEALNCTVISIELQEVLDIVIDLLVLTH